MKTFSQISYAVDNYPTQSATDIGQNVYNPVEGAIIMGTTAEGWDGTNTTTPIYYFPNNNYSNIDITSFTNLEALINVAYINEPDIATSYDFFLRVYCTRKLYASTNLFSVTDYEIIESSTNINPWEVNNFISYFSPFSQFQLRIGNGNADNLGLYKGTFILF